jgi:hypothetical protein
MTRIWLSCAVLAGVLLGPAPGRAENRAAPTLPKHWKFTLPAGDAVAGKAAFIKMDCPSCHTVPGVALPRERTSGGVGPDLGPGYAKLPPEYIAESIIDSHKHIAGTLEKYTGLDKVSSKMGDYNGLLSVRELIDIVAFVRHHGPTP